MLFINNQILICTSGVSICNEMNLPDITLVFDEALYAKVQMIRWGNDFYDLHYRRRI